MGTKKPPSQPNGNGSGTTFRRYVTRNGKTYDAWDYGHKAWPIHVGGTKKASKPK